MRRYRQVILWTGIFILSAVFSIAHIVQFRNNAQASGDVDRTAAGGGVDSTEIPTALVSTQNISPVSKPSVSLYYIVYVVQKGDVVGHIAETHNVSQDAIISLNKLRNTRSLQIGQLLKIPSIDGICYTVKKGDTVDTIAEKYEIDADQIQTLNGLSAQELVPEARIFLPGAKLDWVTLQEINGDLFKIPVTARYYISSRYGWRSDPFTGRRSFHSGIDMAAPRGTSVYAALAGRVIAAGYSAVYGNYVIVRHHSGYQSLYAHLHTISIRYGAWVTTRTRIGTVGSTGRSTGNHLHFSIYKYGKSLNPATLWN